MLRVRVQPLLGGAGPRIPEATLRQPSQADRASTVTGRNVRSVVRELAFARRPPVGCRAPPAGTPCLP